MEYICSCGINSKSLESSYNSHISLFHMFNPASLAIIREMLRWLRDVLLMIYDRLPKIVLIGQCVELNEKQIVPKWYGTTSKERFLN